jgi:CheY-like chemotaxis protein
VHTILIADDQPAIRTLVTLAVASERVTVLQAADGSEAWQLIQRHRPALVLLDVQMPGRDGYDLARAIRADPALAGMKIAILSAQAQGHDIERGVAAGADRYITKPFSPVELREWIEEVLGLA